MQQIKNYGDSRTLKYCAFCGGSPETRDHCPSKVFLDKPYPENLPVVGSCTSCNLGFSQDEEYFACLLACVMAGSAQPFEVGRTKIKRILNEKPALAYRIANSMHQYSNGVTKFEIEMSRISAIIVKLAQGHALFELHELAIEEPRKMGEALI